MISGVGHTNPELPGARSAVSMWGPGLALLVVRKEGDAPPQGAAGQQQ